MLRHAARNFDGGANSCQVSAFPYLMPIVYEASYMKCAFFWRLFLNNMFSQFFHLIQWCRRRGCRGCNHTPKVFIWGKSRPNLRKFVDNMSKPSQNRCTCFDFTKMAPKKLFFFWKSCIEIFGQLKGIWESLVKFRQKWCLNCLDLKTMRPVKCSRFYYGGRFLWILFRASLQKFGLKFFAPPKICLLLHLCFTYMRFIDETDIDYKLSVSKGSINVLSTSKW